MAKKAVEPELCDLDEMNEQEDAPPAEDAELSTLERVREALSGCSLHFNWLGIQRSVSKNVNDVAAAAVKASSRAFKGVSTLIDTSMQEWKDLQSLRTALTAEYNYKTFKYVIEGQRLFRKDMRESIWGDVAVAAKEIQSAARKLQAKRDVVIAWAAANLGDAFDGANYPDDLSTKFGVSIREHSIEPPSYLMHTNAEEYKQTLKRQLADIQSSMQSFERDCMQQVGESVGRMVQALGTGGTMRESTLAGMQSTFSRIATMRFEGTAAFKAAMEEARGAVDGVSLGDLRRSHGARKGTRQKLERLLDKYKGLKEAAAKKAADNLT